jgi:3-oxoacyl-[acyl-carrier protein] reductase
MKEKSTKQIVVTGASSEIGKAVCEKFLKRGLSVLAQVNQNAGSLPEHSALEIVKCDFCVEEELLLFCDRVRNCDVLINGAAVTQTDLLPMLEEESIEKMIQVNILALTRICQSAVKGMMRRRKGCIVNISSLSANKVNRGQSVYGGTKAYMETLSKGIAVEFGARGVRCNCVAPGAIEAGHFKALQAMAGNEIKKELCTPRLGTPEDVASLCHWLSTAEAEFINGQVIGLDGGFLKGL